jgi:hypothetical protein
MNLPTVNIEDSEQNAFVQDWLSKFNKEYPTDSDDYDRIEAVIEAIQETYNYKDHEERKNAIATGGELDIAMKVLHRMSELVPEENEIYKALELSYAILNATKQNALRD